MDIPRFLRNTALASIVCVASPHLYAQQHYTIEQIGLVGSDYTRNDGYTESAIRALNEAGQVIGNTTRYSGSASVGQSAWLYNGSTTVQLGYTGAGYSSSSGYAYTTLTGLNSAGQVAGYSDRYIGGYIAGWAAWFYNGSTTQQLGLTGADYVRADGRAESLTQALNASGQVAGYSAFYIGPGLFDSGTRAWIYDGSTTTQIGLTGAGYTGTNGLALSSVIAMNNAGQVLGYSNLYSGTSSTAKDVWLYSGGVTKRIGLVGSSNATLLNNAGQVAGTSSNSGRTDAWIYNGSTTQQIGLMGGSYASGSGTVVALNNAGQVVGYSQHYTNSPTSSGPDAWFYNGSTTQKIGLSGAGYTTSNGYTANYAQRLNNAGQATGYTLRYKGVGDSSGDNLGQDVWLFNGSTTDRIGLTGTGYTDGSNGYAWSAVTAFNEKGQVAGYSNRYNGATYLGTEAWLYDDASKQTISFFNFLPSGSVRQSDGYAGSAIAYLGDDGLALGYYSLFDQLSGAYLGQRAFYFKIGEGFFDLGSLVDNLGVEGWLLLGTNIRANGIGNIVSTGSIGNSSAVSAYILKPSAVPVPAGAWLFGSGLLGLAGGMRKRKVA